MKQYADLHKTERQFKEKDLVLLKLPPYRKQCLERRKNHKLFPRFYGPYKVVRKASMVVYRLKLPEQVRIRPVEEMPDTENDGNLLIEPKVILHKRTVNKGGRQMEQFLV